MEVRYSLRVPVEGTVMFSGERCVGDGNLIDVSLPGCLLQTARQLEEGEYLSLRVLLPGQVVPLKIPLAVVRWGKHGLAGLEFIQSSLSDQRRLRQFVRRHEQLVNRLPGRWEDGTEWMAAV